MHGIVRRPRCNVFDYINGAAFKWIVSFTSSNAQGFEKAEGASPEDLVDIPAIKLLEFFRSISFNDEWARTQATAKMGAGGIASFSTTAKSGLVSESIEAHSWIRYWISKGHL
ncbi:hypothetical protein BDN67DRAFT_1073004 [Paxillus ammoniavirescens]|nr:hypothetical protein BDN67DRAFT_1073004 [Paxillus ammoniavirescens]